MSDTRSGLKSATHLDYVILAWALRSCPRWLRRETVDEWVAAAIADEGSDHDALSRLADTLIETFDEFSPKWATNKPPHFMTESELAELDYRKVS